MARIKFPKQIEMLLEQSDLLAPIRSLADRVSEILADNKLMFFPDYTDHGTEHIQNVLKSEVELVPKDVWDESTTGSEPRLLCDADAVVIVGATLLHDIAMHLTAPGFLKLVSVDSPFKPLPWFNEDHEGKIEIVRGTNCGTTSLARLGNTMTVALATLSVPTPFKTDGNFKGFQTSLGNGNVTIV
jgi:hypothetical protein